MEEKTPSILAGTDNIRHIDIYIDTSDTIPNTTGVVPTSYCCFGAVKVRSYLAFARNKMSCVKRFFFCPCDTQNVTYLSLLLLLLLLLLPPPPSAYRGW